MIVATYAIYVTLSLAITIWVGHTLHKNGLVLLIENFSSRKELAYWMNYLMLLGFYLVSREPAFIEGVPFGFVTLALKYGDRPTDLTSAVETLSTKVGLAIVVLGAMHFFNMYALTRFRNSRFFRALEDNEPAAPLRAEA